MLQKFGFQKVLFVIRHMVIFNIDKKNCICIIFGEGVLYTELCFFRTVHKISLELLCSLAPLKIMSNPNIIMILIVQLISEGHGLLRRILSPITEEKYVKIRIVS